MLRWVAYGDSWENWLKLFLNWEIKKIVGLFMIDLYTQKYKINKIGYKQCSTLSLIFLYF